MTHQSIKEKLLAFHDRELTEEERREITGHLEGCRECRFTLKQWESAAQVLHRAVLCAPSEAFVEKVMERLPVFDRPVWVPWRRTVTRWLVPVLGYGFAILLMGVAMTSWESRPTTETVLLADLPQASQWIFSAELPDPAGLLNAGGEVL